VDESGINRFLQREKGRAPRGKKVEDTKRGRKYKRTNVIGGMCGGKYMALEYYDHTTTSAFFEQWFEESLLAIVPKGHTIIMDNASFHRKTRLSELAAEAGVRLLFLPTYSPDFNPIEHTWSNMKRWLADNMDKFVCLAWAIHEYLFWRLPQF
jgi:transposase